MPLTDQQFMTEKAFARRRAGRPFRRGSIPVRSIAPTLETDAHCLIVGDDRLFGLAFYKTDGISKADAKEKLKKRNRHLAKDDWRKDQDWAADWTQTLKTFVSGGNRRLEELPITLVGTDFQKRVWQGLLEIPSGTTTSYGALAGSLGTHARPIGGALGHNPVAWLVPCHRVLGDKGRLNGYRWGLSIKAHLLELERHTA